jgi:hypothetical protein
VTDAKQRKPKEQDDLPSRKSNKENVNKKFSLKFFFQNRAELKAESQIEIDWKLLVEIAFSELVAEPDKGCQVEEIIRWIKENVHNQAILKYPNFEKKIRDILTKKKKFKHVKDDTGRQMWKMNGFVDFLQKINDVKRGAPRYQKDNSHSELVKNENKSSHRSGLNDVTNKFNKK